MAGNGIQLGFPFERTTASPIDFYAKVADITARDAIPSGIRFQGMVVFCVSDTKTYQLKAGITNSDWVEYGSGSGSAPIVDKFNGDGSTTAFTLTGTPGSDAGIFAFIGGVYQIPTAAWTRSGTTITFTSAPPVGTNNIVVSYGVSLDGPTLPLASAPVPVYYTSSSGTYTPTSGTKYIYFELVGPGGGGAGSSRGSVNDATNGSNGTANSIFGNSTARAGNGATKGLSNGGAGGTATVGSDVTWGEAFSGQRGHPGGQGNSNNGGSGGCSQAYANGGGPAGTGQSAGFTALANSGGGGGGGGGTAEVSASYTGAGGGAGGVVRGWINNPSAMTYSIGAGGAGGSGGTGPGFGGGAGAAGKLTIWEYR